MNNHFQKLDLPLDYPGQMKIKFPKKFDPEQMGCVVTELGGKFIILNSFIMSEQLSLGGMGGIDFAKVGEISDVFCPFCQKGYLRLKRVNSIHSSGSTGFGTSHHVGNEYEFDCSAECGAFFSGEIVWMHVD